MNRLCLLVAMSIVVGQIGCGPTKESGPGGGGSAVDVTRPIKHGRVALVTSEVKAGNPDPTAVYRGLEKVAAVLEHLLEADNFKQVSGRFVGTFRLESDGNVRLFFADQAMSLSSAEGFESMFVSAVFGGSCRFPPLGEPAMIYAEYRIDPPPAK